MPFPFAPTTEIVADLPTLRIDEIVACRRLKEDRSVFLQMAEVEDPIPTFRVDLPITDDFFA